MNWYESLFDILSTDTQITNITMIQGNTIVNDQPTIDNKPFTIWKSGRLSFQLTTHWVVESKWKQRSLSISPSLYGQTCEVTVQLASSTQRAPTAAAAHRGLSRVVSIPLSCFWLGPAGFIGCFVPVISPALGILHGSPLHTPHLSHHWLDLFLTHRSSGRPGLINFWTFPNKVVQARTDIRPQICMWGTRLTYTAWAFLNLNSSPNTVAAPWCLLPCERPVLEFELGSTVLAACTYLVAA